MAPRAGRDKQAPTAPPAPSPPPLDHNEPTGKLTREQRESLLHRHMEAIKVATTNKKRAQETVKGLNKILTRARTLAKQELEIDLAIIDRALDDEDKPRRDLVRAAESERWVRQARGLPTGGQMDFFADAIPDTAQEKAEAHADGYHAGVVGRDASIPAGLHPVLHQDYLRGHGEGAEKRAWSMSEDGANPERKPGSVGGGPTRAEIEREGGDDAEAAKVPDGETVQ